MVVDNAETVQLKSAVIIAPHHGDASARCFIQVVDPGHVIFPPDMPTGTVAEHGRNDITSATASRSPAYSALTGATIVLHADGEVAVGYRSQRAGC